MDVEFKVRSEHFGYKDPAIEKAIEKYTFPFWPFGRRERAQEKLEEKQGKILNNHGIEKGSQLGITKLVVSDVETEEEAKEKMESLRDEVENLYKSEFDIEEDFDYELRETS